MRKALTPPCSPAVVIALVLATAALACDAEEAAPTTPTPIPAVAETAPPPPEPLAPNMAHQPTPCTDDWYAMVDRTLAISDEDGHGPDLGSGEWMSAVEHKLGAENMPEQGSEYWCKQVDGLVADR